MSFSLIWKSLLLIAYEIVKTKSIEVTTVDRKPNIIPFEGVKLHGVMISLKPQAITTDIPYGIIRNHVRTRVDDNTVAGMLNNEPGDC